MAKTTKATDTSGGQRLRPKAERPATRIDDEEHRAVFVAREIGQALAEITPHYRRSEFEVLTGGVNVRDTFDLPIGTTMKTSEGEGRMLGATRAGLVIQLDDGTVAVASWDNCAGPELGDAGVEAEQASNRTLGELDIAVETYLWAKLVPDSDAYLKQLSERARAVCARLWPAGRKLSKASVARKQTPEGKQFTVTIEPGDMATGYDQKHGRTFCGEIQAIDDDGVTIRTSEDRQFGDFTFKAAWDDGVQLDVRGPDNNKRIRV